MKRRVGITCDFDLAIGKVNLNEIVYRLNEITDLLDRQSQQGLGRHVGNHGYLNDPVSLQDPEDRNFPGSAATPLPLASAAEVALVQLDLPVQQPFGIPGMAQDRQTDGTDSPINGPVRQPPLLGHLPNRNFQLKELDQGKPLYTGQSSLIDPSSGKVMKGVRTA